MTQDTEAERPPRRFAVYSPTGVHIGLWGDGKIAADVAAESPGNTIEELISADEYEALRSERDALREALAPFAALPDLRNLGAKHDVDPVWGVNGVCLTVGDFRRARAALTGEAKP